MSRYASSSSSFSGSGNRFYDDRHGSRYRDDGDARPSFSLSESDFQRDAVLKHRRYLSPARAVNTSPSSSSYNTSSRHTNNHSNSNYNRYDSTNDRRGQSIASGAGFQQQQPPHRSSKYVSSSSSSGTRTHHPNSSPAVPVTTGSNSGITNSLSFGATAKAAAARAAAASAVSTSATSAAPTPRTTTTAQAATAASALEEPVAFRVRSKSKSRARKMAPPKKPSGTEFIALGQREKTMNPYKATYHGSDKYRSVRSRSRSVGAAGTKIATPATTTSSSASTRRAGTNNSREEESRGRTRERERERERELEREREALPAPKAALAKTSASSKLSRAKAEEKSARSKSKARSHKSKSSRRSSSNSSSDGDSSNRGRRRTTATRSKSHSRKASAKRTSPSPSSSASSSSLTPRRESRYRSKSKSKASKHSEKKDERSRGKSKSKAQSSATTTTAVSAGTASEDIDAEIENTKRKLKDAKKELQVLEDEQRELQTRIEAKNYQIKHLELDLETVEKRKRIELEYTRSGAASTRSALESRPNNTAVATTSGTSTTARESDRRKRSVSKARGVSKRPCIVDTDESDDDGEVIILDPVTVKQEKSLKRQRSSSKSRAQSNPAKSTAAVAVQPVPAQVPMDNSLTENAVRTEIPDFFWGKADTPKLLAQHRVRTIPDGSTRKGRHLAFNPKISDYFATSSDDGGLIMWSYERPKHEISKMATFAPTSFRKDSQCAESIVWSPDGNRLAMAFRDPIDGMGEFCVVMLHELELGDPNKPQQIPADRVTSKSTTLHSRGISAIEWIPSGIGSDMTSRSLVTAGSDHAVVLWEEHDDVNSENDYKWNVLHREHRSEVKSICVHSQRQAIYTGGFDGQVIRYDMHRFAPHIVMERRKPSISKINAVLEHPHNPNILLVSSVEQSEHSILLHDLRQRYNSSRDTTMTLSWIKSSDSKSMSQYIVPRWSPAGMHVSCGSKSGLVNIWDVRVRGPTYPVVLPQQSVAVHQKTVLHATWHPRYNAIFSVSNDRTLGLLTFR